MLYIYILHIESTEVFWLIKLLTVFMCYTFYLLVNLVTLNLFIRLLISLITIVTCRAHISYIIVVFLKSATLDSLVVEYNEIRNY